MSDWQMMSKDMANKQRLHARARAASQHQYFWMMRIVREKFWRAINRILSGK